MTIRQFLAIVRAQWLIVVIAVVVVLGAAGYVTYRQTPVYEAQSRLFLSTDTDPNPDPGTVDPNTGRGGVYMLQKSDLATYVEILNSPAVLDPLRTVLGLPPGAPVDVSAQVNETTNVVTITGRATSGQLAADIANKTGPVLASSAKEFSPLMRSAGQRVTSTTVSPAGVPGTPLSPNPRRNLALAVLLGLGAGIGLALVRHLSDTRVRNDASLGELSDRPVLGHVPATKIESPGPFVQSSPHSSYAEAIRRLRTNVLFVDVTTQSHSLVISSATLGEGKTTTVVNLAMAMAAAGSRVLVVDGDLRNPSLAKRLELDDLAGLTTILLGRAEPSDVIVQWQDTTLHVLSAGEVPPNPSELLGSSAMERLYDKLIADFDFVLFDSPPLNPVIDAILINQLSRNLALVVAADRTRKREVENAISSMETVNSRPAGFIMNFVSTAVMGSRYGYYGYGSPYGSRGSKKANTRRRGRQAKRKESASA